jgi:hypothetical protein
VITRSWPFQGCARSKKSAKFSARAEPPLHDWQVPWKFHAPNLPNELNDPRFEVEGRSVLERFLLFSSRFSSSSRSSTIYRRYYGLKITLLLLALFYASMSAAALLVEYVFRALHLIPEQRHVEIAEAAIRWNYTTLLNIVFLAFALLWVIRFLRTGGPAMLRMMNTHRGGHNHGVHHHGHTM